ncbi:hypothetical protein HZI31_06655 [Serratia fonticola]|uniref:O-antigen ligase family protein n=1 Tax=Serratia fonticola TaxID=47917 RepID=UPI0015C668E2|nr:O-antigen ligase family protein [Serratia fonticola]NYA42986.1 hypothetical protein [Serratia fonticola]
MAALIAFFVYILFTIPKIDLVSVGNFNAGIRIDDFMIGIMLFLLLIHAFENKKKIIGKIELRFIYFILIVLVGAIYNSALFGRGTVLFPLRFLEYFVFFFMGYVYCKGGGNPYKLIMFVFIANCAVAIMQKLGIVGGFNVRGYQPDMSERVIGLTSGPWELGVILNFATCYFLINAKSTATRYIVFAVATVIIFITGSRMSLLAQIVAMFIYLYSGASLLTALKRAAFIIPAVVLIIVYIGDSVVAERSASLMSMDNLNSWVNYYDWVYLGDKVPDWSDLGMMSGGDVDASWSMRGTKWIYAIKLFLSSPVYYVIGVGAGAFGNALDGGWLRLLTETGILGLLLFISFLLAVRKTSRTMNLFVFVLAVNMLMIDIYMSYKVMSMFLFFAGFYVATNRLESRQN